MTENSAQPFEIETYEIRTRSIYLDSLFWQEIFPERELYTAIALHCDAGLGQTCHSRIDEVFTMPWEMSDQMMQRLAGGLANFLTVSMVTSVPSDAAWGTCPCATQEDPRGDHNLSDPDVGCARIAAEVGLSVRQLHTVVSTSGKTLMRPIWEQRLDIIAAELANPAIAYKPPPAIAFDWGFNEAAQFSRQFRARFGTPGAGDGEGSTQVHWVSFAVAACSAAQRRGCVTCMSRSFPPEGEPHRGWHSRWPQGTDGPGFPDPLHAKRVGQAGDFEQMRGDLWHVISAGRGAGIAGDVTRAGEAEAQHIGGTGGQGIELGRFDQRQDIYCIYLNLLYIL